MVATPQQERRGPICACTMYVFVLNLGMKMLNANVKCMIIFTAHSEGGGSLFDIHLYVRHLCV